MFTWKMTNLFLITCLFCKVLTLEREKDVDHSLQLELNRGQNGKNVKFTNGESYARPLASNSLLKYPKKRFKTSIAALY